MPRPTHVLVVRHGLSVWNAQGRWQGWADPPLAEAGRRQASAAAGRLPAVDAVVASDLRRAVATAEILAAEAGVRRVDVHPGLRERGAGRFTGLTRQEILRRWPHAFEHRPVVPPDGEPLDQALARMVAAVGEIGARHRGRTVLAVAHGGVIRLLERHLGVEPAPVPNLAGRWVRVADGVMEAGERVALVDPDEAPVTVPAQL